MTSVVKPEWRRLKNLDIIMDKRKTTLKGLTHKRITALFLTTSNEHEDTWRELKKKWAEAFKGDTNRKLYSVALLTESKAHNPIKERDADNWDCSTAEVLSLNELYTWLDSIGIPKTFHDGVVSEELSDSQKRQHPSHHSLEYPIILLVDPDLTIRKTLFGLHECQDDKNQCEQIDKFIDCAKTLPTGQKQPVPASPAPAGAGISADEIYSFLLE